VALIERIGKSSPFKSVFRVMSDEEMRERFAIPARASTPKETPALDGHAYAWIAFAMFVAACVLSAAFRI
jgi:hypothetical protein